MPSEVMLDRSLTTCLPSSSWAVDRLGLSTSGAGTPPDSLMRAIGEFFERKHFYFEVRGNSRNPLGKIPDCNLSNSLFAALSQTTDSKSISKLASHEFSMLSVYRLPSFERVTAPTLLFSLTAEAVGEDVDFLPSRDTCGCAVHFELSRALSGAIREFAERQYLLKFWLTQKGGVAVDQAAFSNLDRQAHDLYVQLIRCGEVVLVNIAPPNINGVIILAVFKGFVAFPVRYCVGLACDEDIAAAASKALKELWQSFKFLLRRLSMSDPKELIHDRYHTYFLDCNEHRVADEILKGIQPAPSDTGLLKHSTNLDESILMQFTNVLCYIGQTRVSKRTIWCVRVVSPDAFLHMDNSSFFNIDCSFSRPFHDDVIPDRLSQMVPFP